MKNIGKVFLFLSLMLGITLVFSLTSCKKEILGVIGKFETKKLTIWETSVLGRKKITVYPDANKKELEILVHNCEAYEAVIMIGDEQRSKKAEIGRVIFDVPTVSSDNYESISICLRKDGFQDELIQFEVKKKKLTMPGLSFVYTRAEDNVEIFVKDGGKIVTEATTGQLKISSKSKDMQKLTIDGKEIALESNKKEVVYTFYDISGSRNVDINVECQHYDDVKVNFILEKAEQGQRPLSLLSAEIFYGGDIDDPYIKSKPLEFNSSNKANLEINEISFSTVKLVMRFDSLLIDRKVISCDSGRSSFYGSDLREWLGKYAGYVTKNLNPDTGSEELINPIDGMVYTEQLLVGAYFAKFKIQVISQNGKTNEYTIKITNPKDPNEGLIGCDGGVAENYYHDKAFFTHNRWNGRGYLSNGFIFYPPWYFKGPLYTKASGKFFAETAFEDIAYVDKLSLSFEEEKGKKFVLYFNVYDQNADKGEFTRVISVKTQKGNETKSVIGIDFDPAGKCLDAFIGFKETLPLYMIPFYYNKPIRKILKPAHNYNLVLKNKVMLKNGKKSATEVFKEYYDYRRQSIYYEQYNKDQSKLLPIGMYLKHKLWIDGSAIPADLQPFLSGKIGEERDEFMFYAMGKGDELIEKVTHTIEVRSEGNIDLYEKVDGFEDVEPKKVELGEEKTPSYILGTIKNQEGKIHNFLIGKVYRMVVTVKYKDHSITDDKFGYLLDYKSTKENQSEGLDCLSIGETSCDVNSNPFRLPTHYDKIQK